MSEAVAACSDARRSAQAIAQMRAASAARHDCRVTQAKVQLAPGEAEQALEQAGALHRADRSVDLAPGAGVHRLARQAPVVRPAAAVSLAGHANARDLGV